MIEHAIVRWSIRTVMVAVWVAVTLFFLYLPQLIDRLHVPESRSINLFIWPMMVDAEQLVDFEKETGIKVYLHYYESNEELLQKIRITGGRGYDLIMPADYVIDILRKEQLLQRIDKNKLSFFSHLCPVLLNHYHDPGNLYSIPYFLGVYGLGVDTDYFQGKKQPDGWHYLFDQQPEKYEVSITDVPRRALAIAGRYLFGDDQAISDPKKLAQVEDLLIKQKSWIRMYTDIRGEDLLATKNCPVVMTIGSDLWMIQQEHPHLAFIVPQEGSFVAIDSFAIPAPSEKQELVYEFLNYLYKPEIIKYHALRYGFCPPTTNASVEGSGIFCPTLEQFKTFSFFKNVISESAVNSAWVRILTH